MHSHITYICHFITGKSVSNIISQTHNQLWSPLASKVQTSDPFVLTLLFTFHLHWTGPFSYIFHSHIFILITASIRNRSSPKLFVLTISNKCSAVAEMGNRLATIDIGRKLSGLLHLFWGGGAGTPSNTMWPGLRPTSTPSFILIHPTVWPQHTNFTERQTGKWSDSTGQTHCFTNGHPKHNEQIYKDNRKQAFLHFSENL